MSESISNTGISFEQLSRITHDFKTPINIILSSVSLIRLRTADLVSDQESLQKYLRYIDQNCHRLLHMIQTLQDSALPTSDPVPFRPDPCDLIQILDSVLEDFQVYAKQRGVEVFFQSDVSSPYHLTCDRSHIERILQNLLSNAVKHTPSGGSVLITLKDDAEHTYLSVIDDGEGIDPAFLPHIFEPHKTVPSRLEQSEPAVGLGLAIVKELAALHGGTVSAVSTPGHGSCFVVSLSRHLSAAD